MAHSVQYYINVLFSDWTSLSRRFSKSWFIIQSLNKFQGNHKLLKEEHALLTWDKYFQENVFQILMSTALKNVNILFSIPFRCHN